MRRETPTAGKYRTWLLLPVLTVLPMLMGLACGSRAGQCVYGGRSHDRGDSFPSTDGCNTCSCTTSGVACTLRACVPDGGGLDANTTSDAGGDTNPLPDAQSDSSNPLPPDASDAMATDAHPDVFDGAPNTNCSFDRTYTFWDDGGLRVSADRSTLSPARMHMISRDHFTGAPPTQCSRQLVCSDPAAVDVAEIQAALAHADVVAAFAQTPRPFYGTDPRPVDGTVFMLDRDDQRGFTVGSGPVPAGLRALVDLLQNLRLETAASAGCANL